MKYGKIYMVGIGGIGMSALARWFNANGKQVAGYDRTPTDLTKELQAEGMDIHFEDSVEEIPASFKEDKADVLVIFTPAIPVKMQELIWLRAEGFTVMKRSQALGLITKNNFTIAIAGTHGKTTTSSMVAHILKSANMNFVAFLGGVTTNYGSNLIMNQNEEEDLVIVVEADEYDRSFLTLHPDIAVVTAVEADHLDIYGEASAIEEAFAEFIGQLKEEGVLFFNHRVTDQVLTRLQKGVEVRSYGVGMGAFRAENWRIEGRTSKFDLIVDDDANEVTDFALKMPGYHNSENATAAIAVCLSLGLEPEQIQRGIASYQGVKRRFEYLVDAAGKVYIDDYAHHPTEVEACLSGVRGLYPNKRITAVFQPHLYSRTRDFAEGFAKALDMADEILLLDIYPAREEPMEGVSSKLILDGMTKASKQWVSSEELLQQLMALQPEVLVTMGAGNIDKFVQPIKKMMEGQIIQG